MGQRTNCVKLMSRQIETEGDEAVANSRLHSSYVFFEISITSLPSPQIAIANLCHALVPLRFDRKDIPRLQRKNQIVKIYFEVCCLPII
mmetsp:Transcript_16635/g.35938  ORF Transcript_16635/g.35938 Transcript_16635/m.35938 type:complete len:89 (-) Transcript_16635:33-299(-)